MKLSNNLIYLAPFLGLLFLMVDPLPPTPF